MDKPRAVQSHGAEIDRTAFGYFGGDATDAEKAVLCVAFLIEWSTEGGNRSLEGNASIGLAQMLRIAAQDMRRSRSAALRDAREAV